MNWKNARAIKPKLLHLVQQYKNLKPEQKKSYICLAVFIGMVITVGTYFWWTHRPAPDKHYSKTLSESTILENHSLYMGDIYWGRRMHDWSQQSKLKEAYPFSRLDSFQPEQYDSWIANLECPSVPGVKQAIGYTPKLWEFNCDTAYLPEAAKWFDVFSLANNHTANQGREKGLAATREQLDKHKIQHFGNFNPHKSREICEVIPLPARARLDGKQQDVKLPVAMCGYHGVYYTLTPKAIAAIQQYSKYMPVIAYPHMGAEYQASADNKRRQLYQGMIDSGADVVLGNHPHWTQVSEVYKSKLIVYSMGNFIFDQQFSQDVRRAAAIDVVMSLSKDKVSEKQVRSWTELGKKCGSFGDKCLQQAKKLHLERLPMKFSYDIVSVDTDNQITKRADLKTHKAILERLNWAEIEKKGTKTADGHVLLR